MFTFILSHPPNEKYTVAFNFTALGKLGTNIKEEERKCEPGTLVSALVSALVFSCAEQVFLP